jgi:hypothetical protein
MKILIENAETVLRASGKARERDAIAIAAGLTKCANIVLRKSRGYVPVETGALKSTGRVDTEGVGLGASATVSYGGPSPSGPTNVFYALIVHEDLTKTHEPPTCARYLARAVRETRGTCANVLRRAMLASDPAAALEGIEDLNG